MAAAAAAAVHPTAAAAVHPTAAAAEPPTAAATTATAKATAAATAVATDALTHRSNCKDAVVIPEKKDLSSVQWLSPSTDSVVALEHQLRLSVQAIKLFGDNGSKVVNSEGQYTSAHWVCAADWESFKGHSRVAGLSSKGRDGMLNFYRFVSDPGSSCCGFTVVGQLMDEMQRDRLSWRLHPLATIIDELDIADRYAGSKKSREAAAEKLPNLKKGALTKQKVCCPTIFRGHSPSCVLCAVKPGADSAQSAISECASSSIGGEDESITSASGLKHVLGTKKLRHGPSAR